MDDSVVSLDNGLIIQESSVHGEGLFSSSDLKEGDVISIITNLIMINRKQEGNKDIQQYGIMNSFPFLANTIVSEGKQYMEAFCLIFHILSFEKIPEWIPKLHRNTKLREQMEEPDKRLLKMCFQRYPNHKVMDIFDVVVTNFLKSNDSELYVLSEASSKLNHDPNPNVATVINIENETIELKALRDIEAGEELFIQYPEERYSNFL